MAISKEVRSQVSFDLVVAVPAVNQFGVEFARLMYLIPVALDVDEGEDPEASFPIPLELTIGSELAPFDAALTLQAVFDADGPLTVTTRPVRLEPVEPIGFLEQDAEAAPPVTARPRRTVQVLAE